jgi:hypothetical protein
MAYRVRERNRFDPHSADPFKLSRSRLEVFLSCPRCFYLDRRLGIDRVRGPAFTLNSATDTLLKKEFDAHRAAGTPHPISAALNMRLAIETPPFTCVEPGNYLPALRSLLPDLPLRANN